MKTQNQILAALMLGVLWAGSLTPAKEKSRSEEDMPKKRSSVSRSDRFKVSSLSALKTRAVSEARIPSRDPFQTLVIRQDEDPLTPSLPGKRGLFLKQLRVKGIVRSNMEWLALVDTPQTPGVFFIKTKDEIFDGQVVAIREDAVVFQERLVDPFGKPYSREVVKRISGSEGVIQ